MKRFRDLKLYDTCIVVDLKEYTIKEYDVCGLTLTSITLQDKNDEFVELDYENVNMDESQHEDKCTGDDYHDMVFADAISAMNALDVYKKEMKNNLQREIRTHQDKLKLFESKIALLDMNVVITNTKNEWTYEKTD